MPKPRTDTERLGKFIDPRVRIGSVSSLRSFTESKLTHMGDEIHVIASSVPLGVLMSYDTFMKLQNAYMDAREEEK